MPMEGDPDDAGEVQTPGPGEDLSTADAVLCAAPSVSTLADQVGARAVALKPLHDLVVAQV